MRIEAYNQVHQLYQAKKVNNVREKSGVARTDQLQFSNMGREIRAAQAALAGTPDIREDLVAPVRTKVRNGTYHVDTASFAQKLMQKASELEAAYEETR